MSASRGRESVTVYCADKRELFEAVSRSGVRPTATELTSPPAQQQNARSARLVRHGEHTRRLASVQRARQSGVRRDNVGRSVTLPEREKKRLER